MMNVTLVRLHGKDVSVGYGGFCFPIYDSQVRHDVDQKLESEYMGEIEQYDFAFELCTDCFVEYDFGKIEEN
jgi:hypothetical protein